MDAEMPEHVQLDALLDGTIRGPTSAADAPVHQALAHHTQPLQNEIQSSIAANHSRHSSRPALHVVGPVDGAQILLSPIVLLKLSQSAFLNHL